MATNMAGRGVDILLGGNPMSPENAERVKELGGLHVIGTERHEARRIDNQLRGRSGRQGDQGSSQFFVSLDDDVIRIFGGERIKNMMDTFGFPEDQPLEHGLVSRAIEQAQSKIEGHHFDARKYVLEFDNVMNKHRETIYNLRKDVISQELSAGALKEKVFEYFDEIISDLVNFHASGAEEGIKEIEETVKAITNYESGIMNYEFKDREELKNKIFEFIKQKYDEKEKEVGEETMRKLEKFVLLKVIDEFWINHLEAMEYLRNSVGLRAYGQRDPLVEYRIEGQKMFEQLLKSIKYQIVNMIFKVGIAPQPQPVAVTKIDGKKIGPNDPCWCNSGKKFKKCHGK